MQSLRPALADPSHIRRVAHRTAARKSPGEYIVYVLETGEAKERWAPEGVRRALSLARGGKMQRGKREVKIRRRGR